MAAPSYATDLNDIFLDGGGTAWTSINGGRTTDPETDDYIQGSSCWSHDPWSSGIEGGIYPSTETIAAGDAIYYWLKCDVAATLATHAAGGMQAVVGSGTSDYKAFYVRGSDDYQYGGWICVPVDPTLTASTTVGSPTTTRAWFGARWNVPSTGAAKGYPMKVDAMRHGRQIEITAGDGTTPATWDAVAAYDSATTRQWGICQPTNTGATLQGLVYWGTASASCYSRDQNRTVTLIDTEWTSSSFTQIILAHASTDLYWTNITILALGTNNRGQLNVTNNATAVFDACTFADMNTFTDGGTNSTWDGSIWRRCNAITAAGGSFLGCQFLESSLTGTGVSQLVWNIATDPSGLINGSTFTQGAGTHHAIEFGTSSPTSITLTDCTFTGFGADGTDGAAIEFKRTTGTVTVNYNGTKPTFLKPAGLTVVWVQSNNLTVTVDKDTTTEVRVYNAGTTTAIGGIENIGATKSFTLAIDAATYPTVDVAVLSLDYQNEFRSSFSMTGGDKQIDIQQRTDRQFENP